MKNKRLPLLLFMILVICILNYQFGWSSYLSDPAHWENTMTQNNYIAVIFLYIIMTIVGCVVLVLPGVTFAIIAALLFGPWVGTIVCLIATTLGALFSFWAGRYFLQDTMKPLVMKNRHLKKLLFEQTVQHELLLLMITRLLPIFPYNLQNFAYGITDISAVKYSICTFVFMMPGVALFTFTTAGAVKGTDGGLGYFAITSILLLLLLIVGKFLSSKYKISKNTD